MKYLSHRMVYGFIFLVCAALIATAYYMEYVMQLEPCPLCMVQRFIIIALGIVALLATLHNPGRWFNPLYSVLLILIAGAGMAVAGRQVWLQSLPPDQVPACGADFDFIVNNFPLMEAVSTLWQGSGECAEVHWVFLGLSIPGWTLVWFGIFLILALFQLFRRVPAYIRREIISTLNAPAAIGTYSQAVTVGYLQATTVGKTVYLSGQIPLVPATMTLVEGDMAAQIRQVFDNLQAVAQASGGDLQAIVKLNIFLTDLSHFALVNEIMADYFAEPYPARAAVGVAALPKGAAVEMDAIMVL